MTTAMNAAERRPADLDGSDDGSDGERVDETGAASFPSSETRPQRHRSTFRGTRLPQAEHTQTDIFTEYRLDASGDTAAAGEPTMGDVFRRRRGGSDGTRSGWRPAPWPRIDLGGERLRPPA